MANFLFTEDKFIVKEEIKNHNDDRVEDEGSSGKDEFVGER